jgi:hypothetical protein
VPARTSGVFSSGPEMKRLTVRFSMSMDDVMTRPPAQLPGRDLGTEDHKRSRPILSERQFYNSLYKIFLVCVNFWQQCT